jgi:hypothetical protein
MDSSLSDLARKLLRRADDQRRMSMPPGNVLPDPTQGEVSYDDSPDPEAALAAADAGAAPTVPPPRPPVVARAPAEVPGEISPELAPTIANLGAVADRAQARMDAGGAPPSPGGSRLAGAMSEAVNSAAMGAGRKPLVPSPEEKAAAVREYVTAKRAGAEIPGDADLKDAQRRSNLAELNANLGEAGATIGAAIGRTKPDLSFYDRLRSGARQPVVDAEKRSAEVRAYVTAKRAGDQKFAQDATQNELEREKLALDGRRLDEAGKPKPTTPLQDQLTQSEIDKNRAEAEKAHRKAQGGAGGDPLGVPGFTRAPGAPAIKKEEAEAMRTLIAAQQSMEAPISAMEAAKANTGSESDLGLGRYGRGADYADQAGPYSQMVLGVKNMAKSGALDEQSERIAQGMIPTPEDSPAAAAAKIKSLRSYIQSQVDAKASSLGYSRGGASPSRGTAGGSPASAKKNATADDLNSLFRG